jgi:hypothetical protein
MLKDGRDYELTVLGVEDLADGDIVFERGLLDGVEDPGEGRVSGGAVAAFKGGVDRVGLGVVDRV